MKIRRPGKTEEYILERDRNTDKPTIFIARGLTWKEMDEVSQLAPMTMEDAFKINVIHQGAKDEERDLTTKENKEIISISSMDRGKIHKLTVQQAKACSFCLTDIKNLVDEDGEHLEMKVEEFVQLADAEALRELGTWIIGMSRLKEKDKKKS